MEGTIDMTGTDYVLLVTNAFFIGMGSALGNYFVYRMLLKHFDKEKKKEEGGGSKDDKGPLPKLRP
jgi:hypothetical protein